MSAHKPAHCNNPKFQADGVRRDTAQEEGSPQTEAKRGCIICSQATATVLVRAVP